MDTFDTVPSLAARMTQLWRIRVSWSELQILMQSIMMVFADCAKPSQKFGVGTVVGVAVGGAVLMAMVILLFYLLLCRRRSNSNAGSKSHPDFFSTGKEGMK